ncbi:helix-turn-helix domain-containing protein [Brachybacterium massiliense]|uniref:helix-turn-helix domain-containing protein n=1 Tax=Brachybacterium massiliense TaxID=1755098 RepID=UPI001482E86E|nr:helix-turn-helix transcriptional regulator [Brachybacterium massiliense]
MDKRGWTAAELSRASGLSRQNLSRLLNDDRDVLQRRPEPSTITGLARAFRMTEDQVLSYVAEAMGFKPARIPVSDVSALSNEELLRVLAERLSRGGTHEPAPDPAAAAPAPDRDDLADPAVTHGATSGRTDIAFPGPMPERDDRPWEQNEYGLAAKRGRNRGREAREQQDRNAEGGGA